MNPQPSQLDACQQKIADLEATCSWLLNAMEDIVRRLERLEKASGIQGSHINYHGSY